MNKPFIRTADEELAKIFRENGYPELEKEGCHYVFINIGAINKAKFSEAPFDKCTFSTKVCL